MIIKMAKAVTKIFQDGSKIQPKENYRSGGLAIRSETCADTSYQSHLNQLHVESLIQG